MLHVANLHLDLCVHVNFLDGKQMFRINFKILMVLGKEPPSETSRSRNQLIITDLL